MSKSSPEYKPEVITFRDHSSSAGWIDHDAVDTKATYVMRAAGWVIHEDKRHIILGSFMDEKASHSRTRIMKGTIISRKRIKV